MRNRRLLFVAFAAATLAACADPRAATVGTPATSSGDGASACDAPAATGIVAEADGISLNGSDLEKGTLSQVFTLRQQIFDARKNWATNEIAKKLLEREAHKIDPAMSYDDFLVKKVDPTVRPTSDTDASMYYKQNSAHFNKKPDGSVPTFDELKDQIKGFLAQQAIGQARSEYVQKLMEDNHFKFVLEGPEPPVIDVSVDDDPAKGPADAPVTVIEFSDYQCPACRQADFKLPEVLDKYKDKVKFVYRDYPLQKHQDAFGAAIAANCAIEQNKYWELHELLFQNQNLGLKSDDLKKYAEQLHLDMTKFNTCLSDPKWPAEIKKDMEAADAAGVSATPTFFVDGRMISGSNMDELQRLIDSELKKKGAS